MPDADRVTELVKSCLFSIEDGDDIGTMSPEEFVKSRPHVRVSGIVNDFAFKPDALEEHRDEIMEQLLDLPAEFMASSASDGGGGWSFLNACNDREGNQWTGLHLTMEGLFALGMGIGKVTCPMPRDLWIALPGGMPYYTVNDGE